MATIFKADNTTALNLTGSWVGGVVPGTSDKATWDSTVTGSNSVAIGGNLSWAGLALLNPGGDVTITGTSALTLGASGLDLSLSTQNITCNNKLLTTVSQTWNVDSRIVTATGDVTHNGNTVSYWGTGSFVTTGTSAMSIGPSTATTVDMTGLTKFNGSFGTFGIGFGTAAVASTLRLAPDTTIVANTINIGTTGSSAAATGTVRMGGINNQLQADTWTIGQKRSIGTLNFLSGGSCVIRDTAGTGAASFLVGEYNTNPGGYNPTGTVNFTGATKVDASISTLTLGSLKPGGTITGAMTTTGNFTLDGAASNVSINTAYLGVVNVSGLTPAVVTKGAGVFTHTNGAVTIGTLRMGDMGSYGTANNMDQTANGSYTIAAGSLTVNTALVLGDQSFLGTTAVNAVGALTINGGIVTSNCNITTCPTQDNTSYPTRSSLTLAGGTLNMSGYNIGTVNSPIGGGGGTLAWQSGTLSNVGTINGTSGLTKTTAGIFNLTGSLNYTGDTSIAAGNLYVNGNDNSSNFYIYGQSVLGGNGTIVGNILCVAGTGSTIDPGATDGTIGTLNTGSVTFASDSTFGVDLNGSGPTCGSLNSTGTVTCAGRLNVEGYSSPASASVFTIVQATSVTGTYAGLSDGDTFSAFGRILKINYTGNQVNLTDQPVSNSYTWNGQGADASWATAANWDQTAVPASGADLYFDGTTRLTCYNNILADTTFNSLTFNPTCGAFNLNGNRFGISNGISCDTTVNNITINNNLLFPTTQILDVYSQTLSLNGIISGPGGVDKTSSLGVGSSVQLYGANTYSGQTRSLCGYIFYNTLSNVNGSANSLGIPTTDASGTIVMGNYGTTGLLWFTGSSNQITDRTFLHQSQISTFTNSTAYSVTFNGPMIGWSTGTNFLYFGNIGSYILNGAISDGSSTGGLSIYVRTGATVTFNAINTYTGTTTVASGTNSTLYNNGVMGTGAVSVSTGCFLGGIGTFNGAITDASGGRVIPGIAGSNTVGTMATGNVTFNASSIYQVDISGSACDLINSSGTVSLAGSLTINSITNPAANTSYTIITASSVTGTFSNAPNNNYVISQQGRTFLVNYTSTNVTLTSAYTWNGASASDASWATAANWDYTAAPVSNSNIAFDGTNRTTNYNNLTADTTFNSLTFNAAGAAFTLNGNEIVLSQPGMSNYRVAGTHTVNLATVIPNAQTSFAQVSGGIINTYGTISGSGGIDKSGTGTICLFGSNTYTGQTRILSGPLYGSVALVNGAASGYGIPNSAGNGTIVVGSTAAANWVYNGSSDQTTDRTFVCGFNGSSLNPGAHTVVFNGPITTNLTGNPGLYISNTGTYYLNNVISDGSATTGFRMLLQGGGTNIFTATNTYTGTTTLTNTGTTLYNNGTISTGTISIATGCTLGGTGTCNDAITDASGGTIAPGYDGTTIATLTTGNITFSVSSIYSVDLNGITYDQLNSSGTVSLAGILTINSITSNTVGATYVIINAVTVLGTFSNYANYATFISGGHTYQVVYTPTQVLIQDICNQCTSIITNLS